MKVTAGARFNASKRTKKTYRSRQWFLVLFSTLLVCASAVTLVFEFSAPYSKLVGFVALACSIFIAVFSAAQIENPDAVDSYRLYQSAVTISGLRREFLALTNDQQMENIVKFSKLYNESIIAHGVNHEDSDFEKYRLSRRWEFDDLKERSTIDIWTTRAIERFEQGFPQSIIWTSILMAAGGLAASVASLFSG